MVPPSRDSLRSFDPDLASLIERELKRQSTTIDLIASENHVSRAVLDAMGSLLTDKYAEGYPGRRYYSGCGVVDEVETLAINRAKTVFGAEHANVQPHSGSQANFAAYQALIPAGASILGMDLSHGGHLTHGAEVSFSGKLFRAMTYGVDRKTERIDYDRVRSLALHQRPALIIAGASSYPRIIDFSVFGDIAREVGALLMVDVAHIAGLIAGGVHPSPVPCADIVTGTTQKTLRGPRGGFILSKAVHAAKVDSAVFPGSQGGPLMHVIAAKAVCFLEALQPSFAKYAKAIVVNAGVMAREFADAGLRVVSGGTDNHLVLVDLANLNLTGKEAQDALERAGIVANRNKIPYDTRSAMIAGGLRVGTPAITTRGFSTEEVRAVARLICDVLREPSSDSVRDRVHGTVLEMCEAHPIPGAA
ncbi:MAG: serine hydroxymethyltransferase [Dehalococcoidia bacterium]|nr:MAG: serine hydroxymethyltransferase [Dehalococcoidia bacterium]